MIYPSIHSLFFVLLYTPFKNKSSKNFIETRNNIYDSSTRKQNSQSLYKFSNSNQYFPIDFFAEWAQSSIPTDNNDFEWMQITKDLTTSKQNSSRHKRNSIDSKIKIGNNSTYNVYKIMNWVQSKSLTILFSFVTKIIR